MFTPSMCIIHVYYTCVITRKVHETLEQESLTFFPNFFVHDNISIILSIFINVRECDIPCYNISLSESQRS